MSDDQIHVPKKTIQIALVVLLGIIIFALIGMLIWRGSQLNQAKSLLLSATPTASVTVTNSATESKVVIKGGSSVTASETATQTEEAVIFAKVKTSANNFMNAYISRSLEEAKLYMTTEYYNSTNQADFAGVSSPGRDRFELTSSVTAGADRYQIDVKVYLKLNGEDSGSDSFSLDIFPVGGVDGQYLVNSMSAI